MRVWLTRALANTVMRAEEPRNRFARWTARWFDRTPSVPDCRFQDADEPWPGHWRRPPDAWSAAEPGSPQVQATLARAVQDLPPTWRDVLIARDQQGHNPADVGQRLGLTPREERAVLNRARATLWMHLDRRLGGYHDR